MAKIMLVDDAAFMRMMIKKALSSSGYNDFIEAQDGAEPVKVIQMPKLLCVQQWDRKAWL